MRISDWSSDVCSSDLIHAGARGKAGGVKLVNGPDEAEEAVKGMLGKNLVTIQTDDKGLPVNSVYVEKPSNIARELYMLALVDRHQYKIVFMPRSVERSCRERVGW